MKPENIIFNNDHTQIKIIDMGISSKYANAYKESEDVGYAGTYRYMSPE